MIFFVIRVKFGAYLAFKNNEDEALPICIRDCAMKPKPAFAFLLEANLL